MPRKKKNNQYWPPETDQYIVEYNNCEDPIKRSRLFERHLYRPFYKLAENIIHTFKFYYTGNEDIEDLKHTIMCIMVEEKIHKFDPSKGAKSYSYFGTIIKRWLINYNNKNYKSLKKKGSFEEYNQDIESPDEIIHPDALSLEEFFQYYIEMVYEELDDLFYKLEDKQIADAILNILSTRKNIEIFKKKALYIYIREQTDCKTPHLTRVIKVLKSRFYELYRAKAKAGLVYTKNIYS